MNSSIAAESIEFYPSLDGSDVGFRADKCMSCHKELVKIRSELDCASGIFSEQRALQYREIQLLMDQLD